MEATQGLIRCMYLSLKLAEYHSAYTNHELNSVNYLKVKIYDFTLSRATIPLTPPTMLLPMN